MNIRIGSVKEDTVIRRLLKSDIISVLFVLIILTSILSIVRHSFLSVLNLRVLALSFSILAIVGMSQMIVIAMGGMNLSIGGIGGIAAVITGGAMEVFGLNPILAVLTGLAAGCICGLINGILITRFGSTGSVSFLVTLATGSVFAGITLGLTNANPFYKLSPSFIAIGNTRLLAMPLIMYIMVIVAIIIGIMFKFSGLGRRILAVGSNMQAAELYGIPVKETVLIGHILAGFVAAVAAILLVARIGSAQTDIGSDWLMFSFAAPIIGGARLAGGKVNTPGVVLGAIVLTIIANAMVHLDIDIYWMTFIQGMIILIAVAADRLRDVGKIKGRG